jgi:putative ABC transport system substrate-binding protein
MRRRDFITWLGGLTAAWPLTGRAQQTAMPVIGYLESKGAAASAYQLEAFRKGLAEAGLIEGRNVAIEFRWADDQLEKLPAMAADLVRRRVRAIVTVNTSTPAAKAATSTIPIVLISGGDPVEAGLVTSLNRPGGNVTGVSYISTALTPKRLELLHDFVPKPAIIAVLLEGSRRLEAESQTVEAAARALGRQTLIVKAGNESEIDAAFATIVQAGAGALFLGPTALYNSRRRQLAVLAARHALPASSSVREFVVSGGLMSYAASDTDAYRRGAHYVGRILKGEKPADMPIELPTTYELVINLATAKMLKLDVPPKLLALADEVLE